MTTGKLAKTATSLLVLLTLGVVVPAQQPASQVPRSVMAPVETGVSLEVLDYGGTGRPLILLQGLGGVAHDYDTFAPKFTAQNHVYAISRRGFGASSKPAPSPANYSAERLGKDVLSVIEFLKLDRPVLAGQSIAGEELSWVGTFHPNEVAGLIYLEAVDGYSFYDPAETDVVMDMADVRTQIDAFQASEPLTAAVLEHMRDSAAALSKSAGRMAYNISESGTQGDAALPVVGLAVKFGEQRFTAVHAPILAIMACPHDYSELASQRPEAAAHLKTNDLARCTAQIDFLKAHNPSAKVLVIPNADHQIVRTNEAEVVRAMQSFLLAVK